MEPLLWILNVSEIKATNFSGDMVTGEATLSFSN